MREHLCKGSLFIHGVDPGIVTTASVFYGTTGTFLNAVNRYHASMDSLQHEHWKSITTSDILPIHLLVLNANVKKALKENTECERYIGSDESYSYELTANIFNEGVLSNSHRAKREKAAKENTQISKKQLQRDRKTREIPNKKFY